MVAYLREILMIGKITLLLDYLDPSQLEVMPACSTETALIKLIDDVWWDRGSASFLAFLISQQPLLSSVMVTF